MPRIENTGDNVDEFCQRTGNGSSTWDVCIECYEDYDLEDGSNLDEVNDKLVPYNGDPDGVMRGGSVEHPDYSDGFCDGYRCEICKAPLTEKDN
jgi:hypothetical protein